jgi:thiol-disulfide isomerase/thioredoxin
MKKIIFSIGIILVIFPFSFISAAPQDDLTVLYFFSANCVHCRNAEPSIKELSREFPVQGLYYGKDRPAPMPFEVRKGDKATASKYDVTGVPILVVLKNGALRYKIRGEQDVKDARAVLRAFRKGALTVSEAIEKGPGKSYSVFGWVESRGEGFKDAKFFLTDRRKSIPLRPWLPVEAVKSPFKRARPRLMSDVVDRPVALKGELTGNEQAYLFTVNEEISLDEK